MTDQTTTDRHVAEARRAVHESLTLLPAWEADRVRSLIADLESAVESRTAVRMADAAPLPVSEARTRLLQALDASYCQALGFSPEGLLAAYEASRTQTVDRDALRDRIDATLRTTRRIGHGTHRYDARCALCAGDVDALTEALAAAVLPATTNHDTDTSVTHRCADCGSGFVPGSDVELTHNCDDHRDAEPAPVDRAAVLREAADQYAKLTDQNEAYDREHGELDEEARLRHEVVRDVVAGLRRMADECPECGTTGACNGGPCPLRRVADETAATETETQQQVDVETLARLLSETDIYVNHGDYPGWDDLAESGEQQYRRAARYLLKRLHIAERQPAAGARQDGVQQ